MDMFHLKKMRSNQFKVASVAFVDMIRVLASNVIMTNQAPMKPAFVPY